MADDSFEILIRTQLAFRYWLKEKDTGPINNIYTGIGRGTIVEWHDPVRKQALTPYAAIRALSAETDEHPFSGEWRVQMSVAVVAHPDDVENELGFHRTVNEVLRHFMRDEAVTEVSEYGDFTAFQIIPMSMEVEADGERWIHETGFEVVCTGGNVD